MASLLKICFAIALIGTFALLILSQAAEPKLMKISDINKNMLDNFVKVQGEIISFSDRDTTKVFELKDDSGTIEIVVFEENILKAGKNDYIEVIGKVSEYKGALQINADKIIIL